MRRSLIAVVLGVLLVAYAPIQADELVYTRFADYLEALRVQTGIPGLSAAIVGRSDVLWERGFGYQDVSRAVLMRHDTPMHLDGLTQTVTAATILRCAEENRVSLDDTIGSFKRNAPEPGATLRQLLSHTSGPSAALTFNYRPERLDPLSAVIKACEGDSHRETTANLLERLAMVNSVPGPDILTLAPPAEGVPTPNERDHYASVLDRLAAAYAVDSSKRVYATQFSASTLTASTGLISTVHDYAQFDLALRGGILVRPETLAEAWRPGVDGTGKLLPHGLGWFVQTYNADTVVWQFGTGGENGSSSMVVTLPSRGVTLVLLANSTGLVKSFPLDKGDVTTSPFARIFLSLFTR
jgi:CubicO group peptidase (beta-lactamase class C family)